MRVLKTPARSPQYNGLCERLLGSSRRECLDNLILFSERHLRSILKEFVVFYNRGRPHISLGPGIPEPPRVTGPDSVNRHELPSGSRVRLTSVFGGSHHEYRLEREAG